MRGLLRPMSSRISSRRPTAVRAPVLPVRLVTCLLYTSTKSDYCQECGFDGEIKIVEDDGKLVWECPHCGNRNQETLKLALELELVERVDLLGHKMCIRDRTGGKGFAGLCLTTWPSRHDMKRAD